MNIGLEARDYQILTLMFLSIIVLQYSIIFIYNQHNSNNTR